MGVEAEAGTNRCLGYVSQSCGGNKNIPCDSVHIIDKDEPSKKLSKNFPVDLLQNTYLYKQMFHNKLKNMNKIIYIYTYTINLLLSKEVNIFHPLLSTMS